MDWVFHVLNHEYNGDCDVVFNNIRDEEILLLSERVDVF